jgi:hypothetical protein
VPGNQGAPYAELKEMLEARRRFEQALAIFQELGDQENEAITASNLNQLTQRVSSETGDLIHTSDVCNVESGTGSKT